MTNKKKADTLRGAASALEHGRYATARKKLAQVAADVPRDLLSHLNLNDRELEVLDRALSAAEQVLREFPLTGATKESGSGPRFVADVFKAHVEVHLATELANIAHHGHRNDSPYDIPGSQYLNRKARTS